MDTTAEILLLVFHIVSQDREAIHNKGNECEKSVLYSKLVIVYCLCLINVIFTGHIGIL